MPHWSTTGQWAEASSFRASSDSHPLNESGRPGETEDPTWQRVDLYNSNLTQLKLIDTPIASIFVEDIFFKS